MKRYKHILLIIFLLIYITDSFSQTDFRKAYYITLENDTVYGLIDYRGDFRNSKLCVYKKDSIAESVKYDPKDIKSYRYIDSKFYVSKTLKFEDEEKKIFVEYLVNGIADLYYYRDRNGDHYLIETSSGRLLELTNEEKTVYIEGKGEFKINTNKYIGLLKATFADCMEMQSQIDKAELNHKSLINITKKYHDYVCEGEKCIIYEKKQAVIKINIAPVIGMSVPYLNFSEDNYYSSFNFKKSFFSSIGILLNTSLPRLNEKLSFQTGAIFTKHFYNSYYEINNIRIDFGLYTYYLKIPVTIKYTYPKYKIRPVINIGYYNTFVLRTKSQLIQTQISSDLIMITHKTDINTEKYQSSFFAGIGLQYDLNKKKSLFVEAQYEYGNNLLNGSITNFSIFAGIMF